MIGRQTRRLAGTDRPGIGSRTTLWLLLWLLALCGPGCLPSAQADVGLWGASANGARVLQLAWTITARDASSTTVNLDVLNAQNAWYSVDVTGMVDSQRGDLPGAFTLGPNERRTFHGIRFLSGNSLALSADGSAWQANGMMATDMLCRAFFGSPLPTEQYDAWAQYYGSSGGTAGVASSLNSITAAVNRGDFWGVLSGIVALADSPSVQAEFRLLMKRELPVKHIGVAKVLLALWYVPDLVNGTLHASLSDSLWDRFTFSAWQTSPPPFPNPKLFVSESDGAPAQGQPGFWRSGPAPYWHDAWGLGDGGHMLWTLNDDPAHGTSNSAEWRPNLPQTRNYEVFVFIPHDHATSRSARYTVSAADGPHAVAVNQYAYNDAWVSLGTYRFASGSGGFLRLGDMTGERYLSTQVGFDAAQWQAR